MSEWWSASAFACPRNASPRSAMPIRRRVRQHGDLWDRRNPARHLVALLAAHHVRADGFRPRSLLVALRGLLFRSSAPSPERAHGSRQWLGRRGPHLLIQHEFLITNQELTKISRDVP
jgi:hypothetical protein